MEGRTSAQQVEAMLLVETNFVLGSVWERRQGLIYLASFCHAHHIPIVIPEVALVEARASLLRRIDRQLASLQQLRFWLNDIARGAGMRKLVQDVKKGMDAIEAELQRKQDTLKAMETFAKSCIVAPLTPQVWTKAYLRWKAGLPPFKELDCLVMETLLEFLRKRKAKLTMFLTMDVEDFDHANVHEAFREVKTLMLFEPHDVIHEFRKFYGVA